MRALVVCPLHRPLDGPTLAPLGTGSPRPPRGMGGFANLDSRDWRLLLRFRYRMHTSRFEARAPLPQFRFTGCTQHASRCAHPFPSFAGEGGPEGQMGCGPLLRGREACTTIAASFQRRIPAFHTPSVGLRPTPSPLRGEGRAQPPNVRPKSTSALAALVGLRRCVHAIARLRERGTSRERGGGSPTLPDGLFPARPASFLLSAPALAWTA